MFALKHSSPKIYVSFATKRVVSGSKDTWNLANRGRQRQVTWNLTVANAVRVQIGWLAL
jgi:hypothetical protein